MMDLDSCCFDEDDCQVSLSLKDRDDDVGRVSQGCTASGGLASWEGRVIDVEFSQSGFWKRRLVKGRVR